MIYSSSADQYDVAVIGAGPAGSSLGAHLAEAGYNTAVIDRARFPRDKLCGEFLTAGAREDLRQLGVLEDVQSNAHVVQQFRVSTRTGWTYSGALTNPGLGFSRRRFDHLLLQNAERRGARIFTGHEVRDLERIQASGNELNHRVVMKKPASGNAAEQEGSTVQLLARCVVGAFGRTSRLNRMLNRTGDTSHPGLVGLKQHLTCPGDFDKHAALRELRETVELHAVPGGYCGLTFIEQNHVNVCLLIEPEQLQSMNRISWASLKTWLTRQHPLLQKRLADLTSVSDRMNTTARVMFERMEPVTHPLLFVGDAACMMPPFTGSGQGSALRSARLLSDLLRRNGLPRTSGEWNQCAEEWEQVWNRTFRRKAQFSIRLQSLLMNEPPLRLLLLALKGIPHLDQFLFHMTRV